MFLCLQTKMSKDELAEFREIFDLVDKEKGGSISGDELGELMDTLGIRASKEEIDLIKYLLSPALKLIDR